MLKIIINWLPILCFFLVCMSLAFVTMVGAQLLFAEYMPRRVRRKGNAIFLAALIILIFSLLALAFITLA